MPHCLTPPCRRQSILSSGPGGVIEAIATKGIGSAPTAADAAPIRTAAPEPVGSAAAVAHAPTQLVADPAGPPPLAAVPAANPPASTHAIAAGEPTPRAAAVAAVASGVEAMCMPRAAEPDRDLVGTPAWRGGGGDSAGFGGGGGGGFGNGAGGFFGGGGGAGFGGAAHRPPGPSPALAGPFAGGAADAPVAPWGLRTATVEPSWSAAARPAAGKEPANGAEGEDYPNGGGPIRAGRRFDEPAGAAPPPFGWRWGEEPVAGCAPAMPAWPADSRPAPALQELSGWRMLI